MGLSVHLLCFYLQSDQNIIGEIPAKLIRNLVMEILGPITELVIMIVAAASNCLKHHRSLEKYMDDLKRKSEELNCRKEDIASRITMERLPGKTLKKEVELWQANAERINDELKSIEEKVRKVKYLSRARLAKHVIKKIEQVERLHLQGSFPKTLVVDARVHNEEILPTAVADETSTAKKKIEEIWECLMSDDIQKMGVHGIGGSGKTTIMKHVYNCLLERIDKFDKIIWVTVSKYINVLKLQHDLARELQVDLSNIEDETRRASQLYTALIRKGRYVLILDDMWEAFDLEIIGIPQPTHANGCKLVLTTRSLEVCRRMDCKSFKMELLSEKESWGLFHNKVGLEVLQTPNIEVIAKKVAQECGRLPLAVVVVAGSLKGVTDEFEWLNALEELRNSANRHNDMVTKVHEQLKFSYSHLKDEKLQNCLLFCALYPEDFLIEREELIELLIAEGIIEGLERRQAKFNKGHAMLNKLENASLLEGVRNWSGRKCVKMHDLIRDMMLQIMSVDSRILVEAGMQLKEIPDEESKWKKDLERVSLIGNHIREICFCDSPNCPNLLTLLLCRNPLLSIEDSFFMKLHGVKVLDLSYTSIRKLPDFVSELKNLTTLLLRNCHELTHVPSLANLKSLRMLDFKWTGLEEVPQGIEVLADLSYLNLNATGLKGLSPGFLPNLSRLQCLILNPFLKTSVIRVEEVASLRKLEDLACGFSDLHGFNTYARYLLDCSVPSLSNYYLNVGVSRHFSSDALSGKQVRLGGCEIGRGGQHPLVLPRDVQYLTISNCQNIRSLCDVSCLENATELKGIEIFRCDEIECVLCLSSSSSCTTFEKLETLQLSGLWNLSVLVRGDTAASAPPIIIPLPPKGTFSLLKNFKICGCPKIKKLFPLSLLPQLKNLEEITVKDCEKMEEIIAAEDKQDAANVIRLTLPKLMKLYLYNLPELKSICLTSGVMVCDSLQEIEVRICPELKRIPLSRPLPPLRKLFVDQPGCLETTVWDHQDAKTDLPPFLDYLDQS